MEKLNTYTITLIMRNEMIQTEREIEKKYITTLNEIIDGEVFEDLNIELTSRRRKGFGFYFVDFTSTNNKTIEENFKIFFDNFHIIDSSFDMNKIINKIDFDNLETNAA